MPNVSIYGTDHHFQGQWLDIDRCFISFSCILWSVSVDVGVSCSSIFVFKGIVYDVVHMTLD